MSCPIAFTDMPDLGDMVKACVVSSSVCNYPVHDALHVEKSRRMVVERNGLQL